MTYDAARMRRAEVTEDVALLPVIQEDLPIRAHTREMVAGRRVSYVLHKLRMCRYVLHTCRFSREIEHLLQDCIVP